MKGLGTLSVWRDRHGVSASRLSLLVIWFAVVSFMASQHSFWRDEVRALALALSGDGFVGMARTVQGEGHPLLWYVMLRMAHAVTGSVAVLPVLAMIVAMASAVLLVVRSPFALIPLALLLFGNMMLFEYAVMARNYGISMLIMFLVAAGYARFKRSGYALGFLLFLLANTNVHSVILVCAFLIFWLLELLMEDGLRWTPALKTFILNSLVAGAGVLACLATVYPPFNDAASSPFQLTTAAFAHAVRLDNFVLGGQNMQLTGLLLLGSAAGLIRRPAAAVALLVALFGTSLLFAIVYGGSYRHCALILSFIVMLYWIVGSGEPANAPGNPGGLLSRAMAALNGPVGRGVTVTGQVLFMILLAQQIRPAAVHVWEAVRGGRPQSQTEAFGAFVRQRPDLRQAIIMADPDFLIEPLSYYLSNPLYLMREGQFRGFVRFTRHADLDISLADLLARANALAAQRRAPVIILISAPLQELSTTTTYREGYNWTLQADPGLVAAFNRATKWLGSFRPAMTDEEFDAYLVTPPAPSGLLHPTSPLSAE